MALRGLLLDLEGVLYQEGERVPGADRTLAWLDSQGLPHRFLTNTTTQPRSKIVEKLQSLGIAALPEQVFTPARAARRILQERDLRRLHLAAPSGLAEDFAGFELVETQPEAVVLGDLHRGFTFERLEGLFRMLLDGALLLALHRNRRCMRAGRQSLDVGPFVAALEYATETEALVVGKPAKAFFDAAVADMGLAPAEVVMVGDDIEADIGGARTAGLQALQVRTGKFRPSDERHPTIAADGRLDSIADLPGWLAARSG